MPKKRSSQLFVRFTFLAVLSLLASTLGVIATAAPSQAAVNPAVSVTKFTDEIPRYSAPVSTTTPWFNKTFSVNYPGSGPAILGSSPDGYIYVFQPWDHLQVLIGGKQVLDQEFMDPDCTQTASRFFYPEDLSSYMKAGNNQITIKVFNTCPVRGTSPGYIVIGQPGTQAPYDPPGTTEPPAGPPIVCGTGKFFGVRGSGEHQGYGDTIVHLASSVGVYVPGFQEQAIDYPAIDVTPFAKGYASNYVQSVSQGVVNLLKPLQAYLAACPNKYVVLGGYSQGAEVVRNVFLQLKPKQAAQVAAVVMFGDPLFDPKDTAIDKGDYANLTGIDIGLLGDKAHKISPSYSQLFQNYCTVGDPICNWSIANVPLCQTGFNTVFCPHNQYWYRGWVDDSVPGLLLQLKTRHVI